MLFGYVSFCALASIVYWRTNRSLNLIKRLLVSAHGILVLLVFGLAFSISHLKLSSFDHMQWYSVLCGVPLISVVYSLYAHRGTKLLHLIHIGVILALLWALIIGGMYITGDSL